MRGFLVAAVVFGAASAAQAADLPVLRGGFTDGYSRSPVSWQGVYVGAQGSWGSVNSGIPGGINGDMQSTFNNNRPPGVTYIWGATGTAHSLNAGYGAFAGYNSQWEDVVIGIEGNYIHDSFRATSWATGPALGGVPLTVLGTTYTAATMKLSDFGSLRLRGGYVMGCFLPYIFVGAGFGDQTVGRTPAASPPPIGPVWTTDSKDNLVYGYSAGAGIDVQLIGGLFGRAEYEYRRITANIESNINTVRLGLGYRF